MGKKSARGRHDGAKGRGPGPRKVLRRTERLLERRVHDVERRLKAFLKDPGDVEALHSLRISARSARGLLAFVAPFQRGEQNRMMRSALREVVAPTPRLRELDVLIEQVRELGPEERGLLGACEERRREECARTCERLRGEAVRKAMRECRRQAAHVEWRRRVASEGLPAERVRDRLDSMLRKVRARRATTSLADAERTHRLRKTAKAVRYAAESAPGITKGHARRVAREMRAVQDELGRLCDARCNVEIIDGFGACDLTPSARRAMEALRERNVSLIDELLEGARTA